MELVANNIKRIRKAKNITQIELARRLGIKRGYITLIEMGERTPSLEFASRLAEALGVPIKELFEEPTNA